MMIRFSLTLTLFVIMAMNLFSQTTDEINNAFQNSSALYNIPLDVLKSIAYVETRFSHIIPDEQDNACTGMPNSYGIMGLRDDDWFGHSLIEAANLIGKNPELLITDFRLNIKGAAALLSSLADAKRINWHNLNEWKLVAESYSGIPQDNVKEFYSFDVFKVLSEGTTINGININSHAEINMKVFGEDVNPQNKLKNIQSDDYPPAVWDPSPNFTSLSINQIFAVVHDTEGSFAGSVSWLKNPVAQASTHYIIRSSDGYIIQLVREHDKAWHVVCWNPYMLGVEHEGYVSNPAYFTEAMYQSSAALFRHFAVKFGIPIDRNHIIGHNEWQNNLWKSWMAANYPAINTGCNTHTDPGQYWNWDYYLGLIAQDTTHPVVVSHEPEGSTDSVWLNAQVKISFDKPMNKTATQSAFTIAPQINGLITWDNLGQTLIFTPSTLYALATRYTVSIDTAAISLFNTNLDSVYSFDFITKAYAPLNIEKSYPIADQINVSSTVKVMVYFNTPILQSSLAGNIFFLTDSGSTVSIKNAQYIELNGKGMISFSSSNKLKDESNYIVILKAKLKNIVGAELGSDYVFNFKTEKNNFVQGTVFDDFESIKNWKDPNYSGSTVETDPASTTFEISSDEKVDGSNSGKIIYLFTGLNGVCRTFNADKPNVGSNPNYKIGLWVYGDWSNNYLEFWFYYNSTSNVIVRVDTLNWTGWKFVEIPISAIGGSGDRLFHSVVIRQSPDGVKSSAIYIDGAQYRDPSATTAYEILETTPNTFYLTQNYPNPFNPSTTIQYQIPSECLVSLKIFDLLGNEVAALIDNDWYEAGTYSTEINIDDCKLSSGVYFYQMQAGQFIDTKKFMILK